MDINQLSTVSSLSSSDQFPIWSTSDGVTKKVSAQTVADLVESLITVADDKASQYAAPSATGFSVTLNDDSLSIWLMLTPVAGYAAGTLVLPAKANCIDRQEILVNSTQAVTTLTINGNGATVTGAPTTLTANAFFRLRYDIISGVWFRVG